MKHHGEAETHLRRVDRRLARIIDEVGPCRLLPRPPLKSTFAALAESIAYQQLTGKAAATIFGRFKQRVGRLTPSRVFALSLPEMRACGLSLGKALAMQDLAAKTLEGVVPPPRKLAALGDEEIVARLTQVRGVGRWTVEMLLIFGLGRPDVLPLADYGVRKGFTRLWGRRELIKPRELAEAGQAWAPWRSVASWYLWRACEMS
ncbi:DNA-3-methyladenine glycosylase 2 family protein [bacterium]|nr:MAG: DNA-3-methyladenine glycosylase 2 family protein [bacterium]